tara:strand:+ start:1020 stop:1307 length:288 start_codon:yes stop_codon:yes gene_type:complete
VPFKGYNVLADPDLRNGIKTFSNWPTIPQGARARNPARAYARARALHTRSDPRLATPSRRAVYINGEFIGGCDTTMEMFKSGELRQVLKEAGVKD